MRQSVSIAIALLLIGPGLASADPWKDESGKGRGGPPGWARGEGGPPPWAAARGLRDGRFRDRGGETPDWARGRGYWDGHFRDDDRFRGWGRDGYGDEFGYGRYRGYGDYDREWYRRRSPYYGGPSYDRYGYGDRWAPPRHESGYRGYPPAHYHGREDDDLDAVYTPFGFYEEFPRSPFGGPQPKARGRIGPIPFEVWEDD